MIEQANRFRVVILGGGSAGWMTAAALAKTLDPAHYSIQLIESETIGTVSVGEATIPGFREFNQFLGIDEKALIKATNATFKLGIEFVDWTTNGKYLHPFGPYGFNKDGVPFHQLWLKAKQHGHTSELVDFNIEGLAAKHGKFSHRLNVQNFPRDAVNYAFHLDAVAYAKYLQQYAQKLGVERIVAQMQHVHLASSGDIASLELQDGQNIEGDFFIDCSGFKALLIEKALHSPYQDWRHWLPCDSAVAIQSESISEELPSHTRAIAHEFGWRWQIPLQHRVGNGYVYSSRYLDQDKAEDRLMSELTGSQITSANHLKWINGCRPEPWRKNCVAIGLSAGFIEPLESTGLQLIQSSIFRLLSLFPDKNMSQANIENYNRYCNEEISAIRDFVILHYKLTDRQDSEMWRYCQQMDIPDSLQNKIELYRSCGNIFRDNNELFSEISWLSVFNGQGLMPKRCHPLAEQVPVEDIVTDLEQISATFDNIVSALPSHRQFLSFVQ